MKIFVDANVLASGLARPGLCDELIQMIVGRHILILSGQVLSETARVLVFQFGKPKADTDRTIEDIRSEAELAEPAIAPLPFAVPDPDDYQILSSAVAAKVDVFCTGDRALLEMGGMLPFKVLSPRETLILLSSQKDKIT